MIDHGTRWGVAPTGGAGVASDLGQPRPQVCGPGTDPLLVPGPGLLVRQVTGLVDASFDFVLVGAHRPGEVAGGGGKTVQSHDFQFLFCPRNCARGEAPVGVTGGLSHPFAGARSPDRYGPVVLSMNRNGDTPLRTRSTPQPRRRNHATSRNSRATRARSGQVASTSVNLLDIARIVLGLVILVGGGELLVRGASAVAAKWGLSPLVIGLTVVAVGTSAPEFAVTVGAVARGETDLAVGNVVGSNIANTLLILGLAALILPLAVKKQLVRFDVPVMIGLSAALLLCSLDGVISRLDAGLLLVVMLAHTSTLVLLSHRAGQHTGTTGPPTSQSGTSEDVEADQAPPSAPTTTPSGPNATTCVVLMATGIALLVAGANLLVTGAVNIASSLGVSGLIIGLTVVAVGTSLPELATSIIAAIRGERDIAIGNVVGSCIANIGLILGLPALFTERGIPVAAPAIALDIPLMLAAAIALAPVIFTGFTVQRWEGALFLALYAAYTTFLVLDATGHQALTGFTWALLVFALPLVLITLAATLAHDLTRKTALRREVNSDQ